MIAQLIGNIVHTELDQLILDVNGVGYQVFTPIGSAARFVEMDDGRCLVHVHTSVREDAIQLFGFPTTREKDVFMRLTSVSGVGPKLGLAVLSDLTVNELVVAVNSDDIAQLTRVSGVGKKTAQRLILEMKSKLADIVPDSGSQTPVAASDDRLIDDLRSALGNLGYKPAQIEDVIDNMKPIPDDVNSIEPLIRNALRLL